MLIRHCAAGGLGSLSALLFVAFLHETPGGIKHAVYPFDSVELYTLMSMGVGPMLVTSLGLLRRLRTIGAYLVGHCAMAYMVFPKDEFFAASILPLFALVPVLLVTILLGLSSLRPAQPMELPEPANPT